MPSSAPVRALLAGLVLALCSATAAQAATTLTTTPGLSPAFDPGTRDYVSRCDPRGRIAFDVRTDAPVSVDGRLARTGAFSATATGVDAGEGVTVRVGSGAAATTHTVRCLPADFPQVSATKSGPTQAAAYFVTPTLLPFAPPYVVILDGNGTPVWWYRSPAGTLPNDFKLLPSGDVVWHVARDYNPGGVSFSGLDRYEELTLDGRLVRRIRSVGGPTDFHELEPLPNGHYYTLSYRPRQDWSFGRRGLPVPSQVLDGVVQEVTPFGRPVYTWSTDRHLDLDEAGRWFDAPEFEKTLLDGTKAYDWRHLNAIEPDGDGFLISARHSDAIYRVDRFSGLIDWKLGGTPTRRSLTVVGASDGEDLLGGQHDVRVLPDGTITLYDNGTGRNRQPRAMRFRIDKQARTATLLESVTDPQATPSFCCGSARKLGGGNWVVDWVSNTAPFFSELTPAGAPVLRVSFGGTRFSYRVAPVEPAEYPAERVRAGMDAMHPRTP